MTSQSDKPANNLNAPRTPKWEGIALILATMCLAGGLVSRQIASGDDGPRHGEPPRPELILSELGFVNLFDGKTLDGWRGSSKGTGYVAQDGILVCNQQGGVLMTEEQYGDFHLKFEFKLTAGANNGIGIRVPTDMRDAAYDGMEIQILDNTSEQYANLQPYQYHGSIYGVAPAKRGFLRPVGQWNEEEIICRGKQVTIRLNGETIVDANIAAASTPETLDHREHPGLSRDAGHVALCGHGAELEFRNIRIKPL